MPAASAPLVAAAVPQSSNLPSGLRSENHERDMDDDGIGDAPGDGGWSSSSWAGEEPVAPSPSAPGFAGGRHARGNDLLDRFAGMCNTSPSGNFRL